MARSNFPCTKLIYDVAPILCMEQRMLCHGQNGQVLDPVVALVPVDMMDLLRMEIEQTGGICYEAVFGDIPISSSERMIWHPDIDIPVGVDSSADPVVRARVSSSQVCSLS